MRLSRPIEELRDHYTVVVVGSGYGGAIAASRLARAGQDVCVLERGREIQPGQYPNTPSRALREIQARTRFGRVGSRTAMFDFHVDRDINVLVGCGLGGTSLINANVALRPNPPIFENGAWPTELRGVGHQVLDRYFDLAEDMLGSTSHPQGSGLLKFAALRKVADVLGGAAELPPLNVTFQDGRNSAGVEQHRCVQCGDCVSGCNYKAKNTVLMNYLPDAYRHGAHIFTEVEVGTVQRQNDGLWLVAYDVIGRGRERFDAPTQFVTADVVVLAAGTLGSTEILLRSARAGLPLSGRLGDGFSGNGDVLAFAYDIDAPVRGVGRGPRPVVQDGEVGPTIVGKVDLTHITEPGLMLQEGAIPGALARFLPTAFWAAAAIIGTDDKKGVRRLLRLAREAAGIPLGAYRAAMNRTLTFLVMCTEDTFGRLVLNGDRLDVDWMNVGDRPVFKYVNGMVSTAARALKGTFVPNPIWRPPIGSLLTVHPLGGCVMGDSAGTGVVNHKGQPFKGKRGTSVHDGLYVADGSIIPCPLDVNPLLTISALAERTCELIAGERGWAIDYAPSTDPWPEPPITYPTLSFSERMSGFFSPDVSGGYKEASERGRADRSPIEVVLTIDYDDLDAVLADTSHPGRLTGTAVAPALSPNRLMVESGEFVLFERDPDRVETWHMWYRMTLLAEDGRRYRFIGRKDVNDHPGLDAWPDTTTLYVDIADEAGQPVGKGIMRISVADFLRQLGTFKVRGVEDPVRSRTYLFAFFRVFVKFLLRVYGGPLDQAGAFPTLPGGPSCAWPPPPPSEPKRELDLPDPEVYWCDQQSRWHRGNPPGKNAWLRLTRYRPEGAAKGPVLLAGGFGMSSRALICDTIPRPNLGEFLVENGYDVWLLDYRASTDLQSACDQFTVDDIATQDWPTAIAKVRRVARVRDVQAFGHCVGSVSLLMALLSGHPEMGHVRSAVCAQFTTDPMTSLLNRAKAALHLSEALHMVGLYKVNPDTTFDVPNVLLDLILRLVPMPREERCGQAVCRWINAIYGCTHRHERLNDATHQALNEMFGVGNIKSLEHLATMMRRERAVDFQGKAVYTNFTNMRIPIMFLQGKHNHIFYPEGMEKTFKWLTSETDPSLYTKEILPDYAHLDAIVGREASTEVYPRILEHLERTSIPTLNGSGGQLTPAIP
jgi:cholesterol oxidase